ncbi:MAG: GIY-YIG nuclease family protein [Nitrospira sp. CR2.1]|nr:GIY-YIG nuclease family protein [Nitrospira sp. CR2.1]MBA5874131.1 GIY-YIG nuclease family protein [Nitrospira sp. CR1.2]
MPRKAPKKDTQRPSEVAGLPEDIAAIRAEIRKFFATKDAGGRRIGGYKHGVYVFYDYDAEPIYVGQTEEKLSGRVSRHLTNQRTDAVAMNVLDPFEVAYIEVWPLDELVDGLGKKDKRVLLDRAEYTVFQKVLRESALGAVLNEKKMMPRSETNLPRSYKERIIPDSIYTQRKHPDVRIARRATTIASLARVISERDVSDGLRRTLLTQARRLERLAAERVKELEIATDYKNI